MAFENIQIQLPNFCLGPQIGTICTIDTTNPTTVLRVKTLSGATVIDLSLSLSSNILNTNIRLEYAGPNNLLEMKSDLTFFTFEKVNDSTCMIKRWQTRMAYRELLLKEEIIKYSSGDERYNAIDFAVEFYHRKFIKPNEFYTYLDMDNVDNVKNATRFFIGPSTDMTNFGATETATVSHIINYIGGIRVYLTGPLKYQYTIGDLITFYSHVYIYSSEGYGGDNTKGSLFKLDAYTWTTTQIDTKVIYKRVTSSRWCTMTRSIASVIRNNLLFISPYDSYLNWRSLFMNNVDLDGNTLFPVYDIIFDNYSIYKLQKKTVLKDDKGKKKLHAWDTYNIQADSILPYSNNVNTWLAQTIITGYNQNIDINVQVRDQYHVGLRDVIVNFYMGLEIAGDMDALFDPLGGIVTTDLNGKSTINYRSGVTYTGHTYITVRAIGSSASTGSGYIWGSNSVISYPNSPPVYKILFQLKWFFSRFYNLKLLWKEYRYIKRLSIVDIFWELPVITLYCKSFFTIPGGNWVSTESNYYGYTKSFIDIKDLERYLPMLYKGLLLQKDSLAAPWTGAGFELQGGLNIDGSDADGSAANLKGSICNRLTLLKDFVSINKIDELTDFVIYRDKSPEALRPYVRIKQPDETGKVQISQLKLSLHTHWVDGKFYSYLFTRARIDQFIFVEDAVPKFFSSKNPINTNIWIRLRPFAFSLNNNTLRMWVREKSTNGLDTGYYEVTQSLTLLNFDSGGGMLGIEALYNPPQNFLYGSLIFVRIEVYDRAYIPNFIYVEYWFKIIPDYNAPYLTNLSPDRESIFVPVDGGVSFDIQDEGTDINLDTLECLLNSVRMDPDSLYVEVVHSNYVKVRYFPPENLLFSKDYKVTVKVQDSSPNKNQLNDSFSFSTADSTGVFITDVDPGVCKGGMERFQNVSAKVLADGNGVDLSSIRMQIFDKDVHPRITPIIYRIS
jgi:hypothetical protein